jgi:Na+-driven multidrug efflux pump
MKDLTKGPVGGHVLQLATFIALSTAFQTLYFLADLYFVGRLGKEAIAGVSLAGNLMFVVLALTQSLGVGATSLIAQAIGRKDHEHAELVFNQALVLSNLTGLAFGVWVFALRGAYCRWLAADATTAELGVQYLNWFVPALFLQFPLVAMGAALRGTSLRLFLFALPAYALSRQPGFEMRHVWYLSVASVTVQLGLNLWLLHREFAKTLSSLATIDAQPVPAET